MTQEKLKFPKTRCIVFLAALVGLMFLSKTYKDALFNKSHQLILDA